MPQESADKAVRFIAKLVQMTQDRQIEWEAAEPTQGSRKFSAFEAMVKGQRLRIYKYEKQEPIRGLLGNLIEGSSSVTTMRNLRATTLEVVNADGKVVYSFEGKTGLSDLYESAAYSASKVDHLIDSVLTE